MQLSNWVLIVSAVMMGSASAWDSKKACTTAGKVTILMDGISNVHTEEVLEQAKASKIQLNFFLSPTELANNEAIETAKKVVKAGHVLGYHVDASDNADFQKMAGSDLKSELNKAKERFQELFGQKLTYVLVPTLEKSTTQTNVLKGLNMQPVTHNVYLDTNDNASTAVKNSLYDPSKFSFAFYLNSHVEQQNRIVKFIAEQAAKKQFKFVSAKQCFSGATSTDGKAANGKKGTPAAGKQGKKKAPKVHQFIHNSDLEGAEELEEDDAEEAVDDDEDEEPVKQPKNIAKNKKNADDKDEEDLIVGGKTTGKDAKKDPKKTADAQKAKKDDKNKDKKDDKDGKDTQKQDAEKENEDENAAASLSSPVTMAAVFAGLALVLAL